MAVIAAEGLTILGGDDDAVIDVVFVHGLQGHPEHTWTYKSVAAAGPDHQATGFSYSSATKSRARLSLSGLIKQKGSRSSVADTDLEDAPPDQKHGEKPVFWPRDLLQDDFPKARVMTFGYDSKVTRGYKPANQGNILSHARNLLYAIEGKRRNKPERPLVFIAHSLGGILVKEVLRRSETDPDPKVKKIFESFTGVFFFGTPHRGSKEWADFGETITKAATFILGVDANPQIVHALLPTSAELEICRESFFTQWMQRRDKLTIRTFQESNGVVGVQWGNLNRMIVPPESSTLDLSDQRARTIEGDHMTMVRFPNKIDKRYEMVKDDLQELFNVVKEAEMISKASAKRSDESVIAITDRSSVLQSPESFAAWCHTQGIPISSSVSSHGPWERITDDSMEWLTRNIDYLSWLTDRASNLLFICSARDRDSSHDCLYICNRLLSSIDCEVDCAVILIRIESECAEISLCFGGWQEIPTSRVPILGATEIKKGLHIWNLLKTLCLLLECYDRIIWIFDAYEDPDIPFTTQFMRDMLTLRERMKRIADIRVLLAGTSLPLKHEELDPRLVVITELRDWEGRLTAVFREHSVKNDVAECLHTLRFPEWNARERLIASAASGGSWLASDGRYNHWFHTNESSRLWIAGKPGSGKSTLTKTIVRQVRTKLGIDQDESSDSDSPDPWVYRDPTLSRESHIVAAFYYSFRGGCTETSHEMMLRSLLFQVFRANNRLFPYLQERYCKLKKLSREWRYEDIKAGLASLHQVHFKMTIVLVVDGMDESDNERRTDVLEFLTDFASQKSLCTVKLLIASRPESYVRPWMNRASHIVLERENTQDIQFVVKKGISKLEQLGNLMLDVGSQMSEDPMGISDFSEIESYIIENSAGVFLWVKLVLKELEDCVMVGGYSLNDLDDLVRSLPKDLRGKEGFYGLMVRRLSERHASNEVLGWRARRILTFLTFANRALSVDELGDALAIPFQQLQLEKLRKYDISRHRPRDTETGLYSLTGGFVEVRKAHIGEESKFAQLIHQTTREFLLSRDKVASPYDMTETSGDLDIVQTCLWYLQIIFLSDVLLEEYSDRSADERVSKHLSGFPFLEYVLSSFGDHLMRLTSTEGEDISIREEFEFMFPEISKKPTSYSALLWSEWISKISENSTVKQSSKSEACLNSVMTAAASKNMVGTVKQCCILQASRRDALKGAASAGHTKIVRTLLEYGRTSKSRIEGETDAFEAAAAHGHANVIGFLSLRLRGQSDATSLVYNALHAAASAGHRETTDFLIRCALVNCELDEKGPTPMDVAKAPGHPTIIDMFRYVSYGPLYEKAMQRQRGQ